MLTFIIVPYMQSQSWVLKTRKLCSYVCHFFLYFCNYHQKSLEMDYQSSVSGYQTNAIVIMNVYSYYYVYSWKSRILQMERLSRAYISFFNISGYNFREWIKRAFFFFFDIFRYILLFDSSRMESNFFLIS